MFLSTSTGTTKKAELKWIIRNFTLDWPTKKAGECLGSSLFQAPGDGGVKWRVDLYPHGYKDDDEKGVFSLFLTLMKWPPRTQKISTKFSFSLHDEERNSKLANKYNLVVESHVYESCPMGYGFSKISNQAEILKCNVLSIHCKLEYGSTKKSTTISVLDNPSLSFDSGGQPNSSLNENLGSLFQKQSNCDVCFIVDGRLLKAHKAILSARSPVFFAMFTHKMKENTSNRIEISEISYDVFQVLLRFIYTDRVNLSDVDDAKDLLAAADRYMLPLLKFRCEEFLARALTKENCTEIVMLADLHNAPQLKKASIDFIRLRHARITKTEGWKTLKVSRPLIAVEILEGIL